jgi:hypothetical protein
MLVYCSVCGCYGQHKAMGLSLLTKWVLNGKHPVTKASLGKPLRFPTWLGAEEVVLPCSTQLSHSEMSQAFSQGSLMRGHTVIPRVNGTIPEVDPALEWDREWDLLGDEGFGSQPVGWLEQGQEADFG